MAGLLPAERPAVLGERLEDVAVADGGGLHPDAMLGHRPAQAEVAHHRGHQHVVAEHAALPHRDGEDGEDAVAVDDPAVRVDREAAVRVAVVRDPEVGADLAHRRLQPLEVRRAGALVDVEPVRVGADHGDPRPGVLEHLRRCARGGAVRRVDDDVQAVQAVRQRAEQVQHVAVLGVGEAADAADVAAERGELLGAERRLDAVLDVVRELDPAVAEELDAVVGRGVVRGRDHHPEVGVDVADQERARRRRDHPGVEHIDPGGREAGGDRRAQELAADPGVARQHRRRAAPRGAVLVGVPASGEHRRGRLGEVEGELRGDVAVGEPADPVRAEEACHVRRARAFGPCAGEAGRGISASSTARPCGPSSDRPSCAR